MKPQHKHNCTRCVYLGTVYDRANEKRNPIDCYWCASPTKETLCSVLGRYGSEGSEYMSSHSPEAFSGPCEYLTQFAERWYLFSLLQASMLGLYKNPKTKERTP